MSKKIQSANVECQLVLFYEFSVSAVLDPIETAGVLQGLHQLQAALLSEEGIAVLLD